ncbi:hypothetical protein PTSG_01922 [Salpingoeca rosetta]|uniref:ECSIT N-terminal domain-containing protein n=1 Tax=Salpingoeca rosetta (strain ATCC 50818 / BSB-021) TaxID=946362 RepID=F2TZC5_SALR5|nr:uncharacterized protein PTSG_01922 [Salpingoeca rosetta]EGD78949.1 hypothetical protein PTSG_01922 [Salpingoeca rosetta]|eukprot:XP_004997905.1 hypothetical protein PTSG_01922 [Salpingoeca rosetta]
MLVAMLLARCGRSAVAVRGAAAGLGGRGAVGSRRMVAASASAVAASAAAASAAAAAAQAWQQRQHVQLATRGRGCCCFMSTTSTPQDMRGHDEHNGDTTSTARDVQVHGGGEGGSPVRGAAPLPPEVEARVRDVLGGTSTRELAQVVQLAQDEEQLFSIVDVIVQNQPARGHVKFINAVLNRMDELNADVEVHFYNRLLEVFPVTNTYKTKSLLDAVWPRPSLQVDAALKVLNRMENEGVMPNGHTFHSLMEVFGRASQPIKKVRSMGYWMRYFMDSNPFSISMLPERPRNERAFMHYTAQRIGGEATTSTGRGHSGRQPSAGGRPREQPTHGDEETTTMMQAMVQQHGNRTDARRDWISRLHECLPGPDHGGGGEEEETTLLLNKIHTLLKAHGLDHAPHTARQHSPKKSGHSLAALALLQYTQASQSYLDAMSSASVTDAVLEERHRSVRSWHGSHSKRSSVGRSGHDDDNEADDDDDSGRDGAQSGTKAPKLRHPHQVFLGGACNPTTWRRDVAIPFLEQHDVTYYNPQVDEWYPELMQEEERAKQAADVLLFVFDHTTRGVASMVEVAVNAATRPQSLVVALSPLPPHSVICGEQLDQRQIDDINRGRAILRTLLRDEGVPVFASIQDALTYTVCAVHRNSRPATEGDDVVLPAARLLSHIQTALAMHNPTSTTTTTTTTTSSSSNNRGGRDKGSDDDGHVLALKRRSSYDASLPFHLTVQDVQRCLRVLFGEDVSKDELASLIAALPCAPQPAEKRDKGDDHVGVCTFVVLCACVASTQHVVSQDRFADWLSDVGIAHGDGAGEDVLASDVYLGGTCGDSQWRTDVQEQLRRAGLSSFNPSIPRWTADMIPLEAAAKRRCRSMLYFIGSETRAVGSLVEAAYYVGKARRAFLAVESMTPGTTIDDHILTPLELKDFNRGRSYLRDAASQHGVHVYSDLASCVAETIRCLRTA